MRDTLTATQSAYCPVCRVRVYQAPAWQEEAWYAASATCSPQCRKAWEQRRESRRQQTWDRHNSRCQQCLQMPEYVLHHQYTLHGPRLVRIAAHTAPKVFNRATQRWEAPPGQYCRCRAEMLLALWAERQAFDPVDFHCLQEGHDHG